MSDATETVGRRTGSFELLGWAAVALVLVGLAVPWFLWGDSTVVAGLPLWIWWHVGWMVVAAAVFHVFTRRGWGVGVTGATRRGTTEDEREGDAGEVTRRG